MSGYRVDSGVPWLVDDSGKIVGYVSNSGVEEQVQIAGTGGLRTVILGDSRTQQNYDETATEIQGRPRWFTMLNSALGQPFELVANAAVNGERTDQILARFDSSGLGCGFGGIGSGGSVSLLAHRISLQA